MKKTREQRRKEIAIPEKFVPRFFEDIDGRAAVSKEIRRRYQALRQDAGVESVQQDLICQRAVFISVQLETMECIAAESGKFDPGVYTQMSNALLGLLRAIGLERRLPKSKTLKAYVEERTA